MFGILFFPFENICSTVTWLMVKKKGVTYKEGSGISGNGGKDGFQRLKDLIGGNYFLSEAAVAELGYTR